MEFKCTEFMKILNKAAGIPNEIKNKKINEISWLKPPNVTIGRILSKLSLDSLLISGMCNAIKIIVKIVRK